MTTALRYVVGLVLAGALPGMALAQGAVIRLEAKRDPQAAAQAAQGWADRFDGVVTLPLAGGWTGIAIGPLPADRAGPLLEQLKAAGKVPQDAFISTTEAGTALTSVGEPADASGPQPVAPTPGTYLRLESFQAEPDARGALARIRDAFPGAGLWRLPDGWFAVALGPVADDAAAAWLPMLADADVIPDDAMLVRAADLGEALDAGTAPDLPAPGAPEPLPPLEEVQRALRWAGHYDGQIDGKDGPRTRAAIQAEITQARASTDPGTALRLLAERRAAWADEQGLAPLVDEATGLTVSAPMRALMFDRAERALSIYGPRDGSGAALILFSQPGDQQALLDLAGLVTALGWVPQPERVVQPGHVTLHGANDAHIGAAEGWVRDGRAEGYVLIWPAADADTHTRLQAEISDSLMRHGPGANAGTAPTALP
ncbi:peptidoglycan-binding protein [Paracoccus sp. Ld10]|uniref:peptidoglycan-binding domain-containing protein n=1 Tax=Paracoccus sp. Ld10 TaxID=649158 RepID=UPI0038645466